MNALYDLMTRLDNGKTFGKERLAGGGLNNKQLNDFVKSGPLTTFFTPPDTVFTAHVLKDGSDYTPYEGMSLTGWPELTMVRGRVVARDGEAVGPAGHGIYLPRDAHKVRPRI